MDGALVVVLVLLWAVVLLPGAIRSRRSSAHVTVGGFERAMDVLRNRPAGRELLVPGDAGRIVEAYGPGAVDAPVDVAVDETTRGPVAPVPYGSPTPAPGSATAPARSPRAQRRAEVTAHRRQTFVRMLAATGGLLVLALLVGGPAWALFGLSLVATGGYATLLRRWKLQRDEASAVVRTIRTTERRREATTVELPHAVGESPMFGGIPVATRPDEPWHPQTGVRIRRWDD